MYTSKIGGSVPLTTIGPHGQCVEGIMVAPLVSLILRSQLVLALLQTAAMLVLVVRQ